MNSDEPKLTASMLYAISQGSKCVGIFRCHWCGSPCSDFNRAEFIPRQQQDVGIKISPLAKIPSSSYECWGCWLWNRKRLGIQFLEKGYKDGQCPLNHSWLITEKGAWALSPWDGPKLHETLLKPPLKFVLALLSNGPIASGIRPCDGILNRIQLAFCNDFPEIKANTELHFTLNNIDHLYTVDGLENGGAEIGTQVLLKVLGPIPKKPEDQKDKRKETRGRHGYGPAVEPPDRKVITSKQEPK